MKKEFENLNFQAMKNILLFIVIVICFTVFACEKKESERFRLLTGPVWAADSLLANGVDATGPGELLADFSGDAKFQKDGTGTFGEYTGTWRFNSDETQLVIETDSLPIPVITDIKELTSKSLKVTTVLPNLINPLSPYNIRMTFKAK